MKGRLRGFIIGGFWLIAALALLPAGLSWADYYPDQGGPGPGIGIARVSYQAGDALFNSPDTDEWSAVTPNFTLQGGDRLWAGDDSKIEVKFRGGGTGWLNYDTELDMTRLQLGDDGNVYQVGLVTGEASFSVRNFRVLNSVFQVDTPAASVRAYGKALFRVTATSDGATQVGVTDGSVEVETQEGVTTAREGDLLEVSPDGGTQVSDLPAKDAWDNWVDSRLARYAQPARSARYLPPGMGDYAYEFDRDGRWTSYGPYGNVWVPAVAADWSPYSNGRWVFAGGDYVWLGYDPWYAPFHYGRWYWTVSLGWFWIPPASSAVYWSPGYVGWCYGPTSVYWVPLGPSEIYYGRGYYGPQSVNIVNVRQVNVTNVYVNARFRNAVVGVRTDDFTRGRVVVKERIRIREQENPFVNRGRMRDVRLIGAAPVREIKPTKAMRQPKPDFRPPARALPPERVEKAAPLIRKRAAAREQGASAFVPGAKARRKEEIRQQREQKQEERIQQRQQKQEERIQKKEQKQQERQQKQQERIQQQEQIQQERQQRPEERIQQRQQKQQERIQQQEQKQQERIQQQEQKKQERIQQREQRLEQRPGFRREPGPAQPEKGAKPEKEKKVKEKKPKEEKPKEGEEGQRPRGE